MANDAFEAREFHRATNAIYQYWIYQLCDVYIVQVPTANIPKSSGKFQAVDARGHAGAKEVCSRSVPQKWP